MCGFKQYTMFLIILACNNTKKQTYQVSGLVSYLKNRIAPIYNIILYQGLSYTVSLFLRLMLPSTADAECLCSGCKILPRTESLRSHIFLAFRDRGLYVVNI